MFKKILGCVCLVVLLVVSAVPAFAGTVTLSYTFTDEIHTEPMATSTKNDDEQYWYIKLTSGPTSTNIFGGRPRTSSAAGSSYYVWNYTFSKSKKYEYFPNTVTTATSVTFYGKKDSDSTSSKDLTIAGSFCP